MLENSSTGNTQNANGNDTKSNNNTFIADCSTEISVAYDILYNQWLQSRELKVCIEILQALSSMYALLPAEKIQDQLARLIPSILGLFRRSLERNSVSLNFN